MECNQAWKIIPLLKVQFIHQCLYAGIHPEKGELHNEKTSAVYSTLVKCCYRGDYSGESLCPCFYGRGGGDFKGLIDKLDYIKALGFTAIWITPVVENDSGYDYLLQLTSDVYTERNQTVMNGANDPLSETGRAYYGDNIEGDVVTTDFGEYFGATQMIRQTVSH